MDRGPGSLNLRKIRLKFDSILPMVLSAWGADTQWTYAAIDQKRPCFNHVIFINQK
jgi:hypothetical protein